MGQSLCWTVGEVQSHGREDVSWRIISLKLSLQELRKEDHTGCAAGIIRRNPGVGAVLLP